MAMLLSRSPSQCCWWRGGPVAAPRRTPAGPRPASPHLPPPRRGMHGGTGRAGRGPGVHVQLSQRRVGCSTKSSRALSWTRVSSPNLAGGASRQSSWPGKAACRASSTCCRRCGHSGWPGPGSCSRQDGWVKTSIVPTQRWRCWLPQRFAMAIGTGQHPGQHEQQVRQPVEVLRPRCARRRGGPG